MTQTYQDPVSYLNEVINKRGRSTHNGVYLTNVTVVCEASSDYGYKEFPPSPDPCKVREFYNHFDEIDWLKLLVSLRSQKLEQPEHISKRGYICQFMPEGPNLSLNVFMPVLYAEHFSWSVSFYQELLKWVGDFVGKVPTYIRFNIGYSTRSWEDLVRTEDVREMDLNF